MGNQAQIKQPKQDQIQTALLQESQLGKFEDELENKRLYLIYDQIIKIKKDFFVCGDYDDIHNLKLQLINFFEGNQSLILQHIIDYRYLLYRFIEDYKDCYFFTINRKYDKDLQTKLTKYIESFQVYQQTSKIPIFDIEYQLKMLSSFEQFKSTKSFENKQKEINNIQTLYETVKNSAQESVIQTQIEQFKKQYQDILGEEIQFSLNTKFDIILKMVSFKQEQNEQINCLKLIQPLFTKTPASVIEVLTTIIFFIESELQKETELIIISAESQQIFIFVKNLINILTQDFDIDKQESQYSLIREFIYLISLHLVTIFEKKGQLNYKIYEELWFFIAYQESQLDQQIIQSLQCFRKQCFSKEYENNKEKYNQLMKLKFKAEKLSDVVNYIDEIKSVNINTVLTMPYQSDIESFNQQLIYLSGDIFVEQEEQKQSVATYQQVINYYLKDSNTNSKTLFIEGPIDSGKTFFIKKILTQIEDHNKKNLQKTINTFYIRAKYFKLENSTIDDTLLNEPFSLTLSQKQILLDNGMKLFIIDGLNNSQQQRKNLIKLIASVEGKNVHFLITSREENMRQDVFTHLQNYSIQQLQINYTEKLDKAEKVDKGDKIDKTDKTVKAEKGNQEDYEPFPEQIKKRLNRKINLNQLKIYYMLNDPANIYMYKEVIRSVQKQQTKMEDTIKKIQNQSSLIEIYIDFMIENACAIQQNTQLNKSDQGNMANLCKEYLQCLAFAAYLNEYKKKDEDFSVQNNDVLKYLSVEANRYHKEIQQILIKSNLLKEYRDDLGLLDNTQPYYFFKLNTVFMHCLIQSFMSDFYSQVEDINSDSEEKLVQFKINQRPIARHFVNKFQNTLFNMLFQQIVNFKSNNVQENQSKIQENQENNSEQQDKQQEQVQNQFVLSEQKYVKMCEKYEEINPHILKYMQKSNTQDSKFLIGTSNIISAIFSGNFNLKGYPFKNLFFPFAYFNHSLQRNCEFSNQGKNQIIQKGGYLEIPGNENITNIDNSFIQQIDLGNSYQPRQIVSFNEDMFFYVSNNYLYKCVYDEKQFGKQFVNHSFTDLNQKKSIVNLRRCDKYIYCSTGTNIIYRIDPETFQQKCLEFDVKEHTYNTFCVSDCGKYISTYSQQKLWIWNVDEQKISIYHSFPMNSQVFYLKFKNGDSNIIVFATENTNRLYILNINLNKDKSFEEIQYDAEIVGSHKFCSVDFHDNIMVSGNYDRRLRIHEYNQNDETKYKLLDTITQHQDWIRQVQLSSCGRYILIASDDYTISMYDREKKEPYIMRGKHQDYVMFASFIRKNKMVVSAGNSEQFINIWDVTQFTNENEENSGEKQKDSFQYKIQQNFFSSNYLKFFYDNKTIAQATPEGKILIWKIMKQKEINSYSLVLQKQLSGHQLPVICLSYSPDKQLLASCSNDRKILLWNVEDNYKQIEQNTKMEHDDAVSCVEFSLNSSNQIQDLASGGWDDQIKIWRNQKNSQNFNFKLIHTLEHDDAILSLAYSPSNEYLVSGSYDKKIKIWKVQDNYKFFKQLTINSAYSLHFTSNNKLLIAGFKDQSVRAFETQNFKQVYETFFHQSEVGSVSSINKGNIIVSSSQNGNAFYHRQDAKGEYSRIKITSHSYPITSIAPSSNSKYVATSSRNCFKLFKYNPITDTIVFRHETEIKSTRFSFNGILASIDQNGILKMWDSNQSFQQIASIDTEHGFNNGKWVIVFSYNCEYFLTINSNECRVWSKYFKLIRVILFDYPETQAHFSNQSTFLVITNARGTKYYKKDDKFLKGQDLNIETGQYTIEQVLTYLKHQKNNSKPIPFLNYINSTSFYLVENDKMKISLKNVVFTIDDKLMFLFSETNSRYSCYQAFNEFKSNTVTIDEKVLDNFNDVIYDYNYDHLNNPPQENQIKYINQLINIPQNLYSSINSIESRYKLTSSVSFNSKYYVVVGEINQIWVFNNYEFIEEIEVEETREDEIEEEDFEVQVEEEYSDEEYVDVEEEEEEKEQSQDKDDNEQNSLQTPQQQKDISQEIINQGENSSQSNEQQQNKQEQENQETQNDEQKEQGEIQKQQQDENKTEQQNQNEQVGENQNEQQVENQNQQQVENKNEQQTEKENKQEDTDQKEVEEENKPKTKNKVKQLIRVKKTRMVTKTIKRKKQIKIKVRDFRQKDIYYQQQPHYLF